jgi:hypothetical protein
MRLDLLTNATVVDDAIRFVSQKSKVNLKLPLSSSDEDENESKPYYKEEKDQLQEKQEEEVGGVTINQVF